MSFTQGDFVGAWVGAVADPKAKKIVAAAGTNTPIGKKIRAGATVVKKAKAGDVKAKLAVAKIVQKSKTGDPQAKRDLNALKAGKIALNAKGKAGKTIARKAQADKIVAGRQKIENKAGDKLAQMSRKRQLSKIATVERAAAKGNPKAKAAIAKVVAKAHKGDPKAKTTVAALTLSKRVRVQAATPREAKNLSIAAKTLSKARKGDRRAIQTLKVTQDRCEARPAQCEAGNGAFENGSVGRARCGDGQSHSSSETPHRHRKKESRFQKLRRLEKESCRGSCVSRGGCCSREARQQARSEKRSGGFGNASEELAFEEARA